MTERLLHTAAAPFEAALRVPALAPAHRARGLHGHSYTARVRAELPAGWNASGADGFRVPRRDALQTALQEVVAPLDYADLNDPPVQPDRREPRPLAARSLDGRRRTRRDHRWHPQHRRHRRRPGAGRARHLWHRFRFEAAHRLPRVPEGHPCGRMHGHGFEVILHVDQDVSGADMGVDFERIAALFAPCTRSWTTPA
jgi:6-pyruvoyltetrahydropterin/6-carboxytetrahydropterin synthase